ncbi:hypothetical protein KJN74_05555 [Candidatus Bathyarchaeota archaeon]|nr:hypothetical protein [Candidatus Bathyarchaeota archaeon]
MKTIEVAMIGVSAALYAILGILTNLGIVAPFVGVVKFWPAVFVPGIFAVLFGPWVGGLGAAIGIFVSDMVQPGHGIALLSISVGCTSNFVAFYLVGMISQKKLEWRSILALLTMISLVLSGMTSYLFMINQLSFDIMAIFLGVILVSDLIVIGFGLWKPEWKNYGLASVVGLLVGSSIIGFGLWAYSQVLGLPLTIIEGTAPFYAIFLWLVWTFATEIPFLVFIVPIVVKICYQAIPFLKQQKKE